MLTKTFITTNTCHSHLNCHKIEPLTFNALQTYKPIMVVIVVVFVVTIVSIIVIIVIVHCQIITRLLTIAY